MTITAAQPTFVQIPGNSSATVFAAPMKCFAATDVLVGFIVAGAYTAQTSGYTVGNIDTNGGFTVTFAVPPPTGTTVDIRTVTPQTQGAEFANLGTYLPENSTEAFDRLTRALQDVYRLTYLFGIHGPDQEAVPWAALPKASQRALQYLAFDGLGNPVATPALPGTANTAQSLGLAFYPILPGETGVVNIQYAYGRLRRYGALLDGATDDCSAMVSAAASAPAVGGKLIIDGPMAMASASLALLPNQAVELLSGTTIQCQVGNPITITGTTACNVFHSTDASHIELFDVYAIGNGASSATLTTGYLWYIKCTAAATKEATNLKFIRGGAENFAGLYWIYLDNTAATTYAITKFLCDGGSRFTSKTGNNQGQTSITTSSSVFGFSGSDLVTNFYSVKDCIVRNCIADGTFIKNFLYFWSGCLRCKAHGNTLIGFGSDAGTSDDVGSYALAAYDHSHGTGLQPSEIEFYDNTIDVVRDCGIYAASANRILIHDNQISGQTDTNNTLLPKGAIVANACTLPVISDNVCNACYFNVSVTQNPDATAVARVNNTTILAVPANGFGVWLSGTTGGNANDIGVNGLSVDTQASGVTGLHIVATATVGINNLDVQNIDVHACANGINLFAPDSSVPAIGNARFSAIKLRHITGNILQWLNATNAATRVVFENIDVMDMVAGAVGFFIQSATGVTVRGITFHDLTSGATVCWYGAGAQGRVSGVQFNNVAIANRYDSGANQLGVNTPTWTGNDNDFVQDLNPNELGSASSKYCRAGWVWDRVAAAWKEQRMLTGN